MTTATAIHIVDAFQTLDGQRFHSLVEARTHTRNERLMAIYKKLMETDPKFARLDADLFVAACVLMGQHIGIAATDPMEPVRAEKVVQTADEARAASRAAYVQTPPVRMTHPGVVSREQAARAAQIREQDSLEAIASKFAARPTSDALEDDIEQDLALIMGKEVNG